MKKLKLFIASFALATSNFTLATLTCQAQAIITIQPNASLAQITTDSVGKITAYSVNGYATLLNNGNDSATTVGICYNTSANPDITNNTIRAYGAGTYSVTASFLTPNTTYYVRAYATNATGTAYGNELSFTTKIATLPAITTDSINTITATSASGFITLTDNGNDPNIYSGFCYSTSPNPTIADTTNSTYLYNYAGSRNLNYLQPNTTYYIRAFAYNSIGTSYGNELTFTTKNATLPTVTTNSISNVTAITSMGSITVSNTGNDPNTTSGICYSTSPNPDITNNITPAYGAGTYTLTMTNLSPNTMYYAKAYASNAAGTGYGIELSFTTDNSNLPIVTTDSITNITATTAIGYINLLDKGNDPNTNAGFCYSTSPNPTIADSSSYMYNYNPGYYNMTGLIPNTTYYLRAYATNGMGTSYGSQLTFTTKNATLPIITTDSITNITATTAMWYSQLSDTGNDPNTNSAFCYSTSPNPDITNGIYSWPQNRLSMSNLSPNTTYYVRAFATNTIGTAYGNELSFTTSSCYSEYLTSYDSTNANGTFTLTVDPYTTSVATSYRWDFGDGSTSTLAAPNHVYTANGLYNVCLTIYTANNDSCTYCHTIGKDAYGNVYRSSGFSLQVVNNISTGIKETEEEQGVSIYPNPTNGIVSVKFDQTVNNTSVKLYSLTGQKLMEENNVNNNLFTLDISNQTTGMYILEISQNGAVSRNKVIKE